MRFISLVLGFLLLSAHGHAEVLKCTDIKDSNQIGLGSICDNSFGRQFRRVEDPNDTSSRGWLDLSQNGKIWFDKSSSETFTYDEAVAYCKGKTGQVLPTGYPPILQGHDDFPNELSDIDKAMGDNNDVLQLFPDMGGSLSGTGSWTSSPDPKRPNRAYMFMAFHENTYSFDKTVKAQAYCVSQ